MRFASRQKEQFQLFSVRFRVIVERQKIRSKAADAIYFSRPKSLEDYEQQCKTLKTMYVGWEADLNETDSLLSQYDLGREATEGMRSTLDQSRRALEAVS